MRSATLFFAACAATTTSGLLLSSRVPLRGGPAGHNRRVRQAAEASAGSGSPASDGPPIAGIQFYDGEWEPNVPDVRLTRSRDAQTGTATFRFDRPSFFNVENEEDVRKDFITAMTMIDEEGSLSTAKVNARFVNGKPETIEARLEMYSPAEWDRFMRFMTRYAEANGLGFNKAK